MRINCEDTNQVWRLLLSALIHQGYEVGPRGQGTHELLVVTTVVPMTAPVVTIAERGLGYRFMAAEAAWILSGDNRVSTIAAYTPRIKDFSDDGVRFFGAYGPPLRDQFGHVVKCLRADPASRQAIVSIWRPNPPPSKDIPCTIALQWVIRDNALDCIATMRSSDAWLGWPYDVFNFSMISFAILSELDIDKLRLGSLYVTAGSQHLYDRNLEQATMIDEGPVTKHVMDDELFAPVADADDLIERLWYLANNGGLVRAAPVKG